MRNRLNRTSRSSAIIATALGALLCVVSACSSGSPKASSVTSITGQTSAQLFQRATRALVSGGFEIKAKDEAAGTIQALRPMKGSLAKPGYGNNITILIADQSVEVTVFKAEGVIAAHTVEEIRDEIVELIKNTK